MIKEVAPYLISKLGNSIISVLKCPRHLQSALPVECVVNFLVPLYVAIHDKDIVRENQAKVIHQKLESSSSVKFLVSESTSDDPYLSQSDETRQFVNISQMLPKNKAQQIATVFIQGFPALKLRTIEVIIDTLFGQEFAGNLYEWSFFNHDMLDHANLFVRFKNLSILKWFLDTYKDNFKSILGIDTCSILYHNEVDLILKDVTPMRIKVDLENVSSCTKQILASSIHTGNGSATVNTKDLDEAASYYKYYRVDKNELIDVPNDMKDTIEKSIIVFRSKMLALEKDKRKQEIERERIQTKEKLKRIFENVKETRENSVSDSLDEQVKPLESIPVASDELQDLNDQEYQEYLEMMEVEARDSEYSRRLVVINSKESSGRAPLVKRLSQLMSYEDTLIENKLEYIEEIKIDSLLKCCKSLIGLGELSPPRNEALRLYTTDHLRYIKRRKVEKEAEAKADEDDRAAEALNAAQAVSAKQSESDQNSSRKPTKDIHILATSKVLISNLTPQNSLKLTKKITDLVAEYLGIPDKLLIDVISEHIQIHNFDKKHDLIADLTEVLDDDSKNLVEDLWVYIENLS